LQRKKALVTSIIAYSRIDKFCKMHDAESWRWFEFSDRE